MKKTPFVLLLSLLLPLTVSAQTPGKFKWNYSTAGTDQIAGNADDDPPCSATLLVNCIKGFRLFYKGANGVEQTGVSMVLVSACTLNAGSVSDYTCRADMPSALAGVGRYERVTWLVRAVALDPAGVEVLAPDSNTVDVQRRPRPATALAVE